MVNAVRSGGSETLLANAAPLAGEKLRCETQAH
jgi:hypothetical protein